jgi:hypothetical protein
MVRYISLLLLFGLAFWGCEEATSSKPDTTPPTITITYLVPETVSEIVSITCISSDNEEVEKVELWANGVYNQPYFTLVACYDI